MIGRQVLILLDADVLNHFAHADKISLLNQLFPDRLRMLDMVLDELRSNQHISAKLDMIFTLSGIKEIAFPTNELLPEYINLKKEIMGKGESACLVYCKNYQHIIASSNTSDTLDYCRQHDIAYLTTLDIFCIASHRKILTTSEINRLIKLIQSKGSHLCCNTIQEHQKKHFDSNMLNY
ncbi:MAG: hypothetical protein K9J21_12195 [Bacteroidales bacterium]|nr:hypothetical protein [Bacteroidales bacterium]